LRPSSACSWVLGPFDLVPYGLCMYRSGRNCSGSS
jgi:hypothetical protein